MPSASVAIHDPILDRHALWRRMDRLGHLESPEATAAFADELRVSVRTLGAWLTGAVQPPPPTLALLARVQDVTPAQLTKERQ